VAVLVVAQSGCRITPDEIQKIEAENQLLRQEIRTIKDNCSYYKVLDLDVEEKPGGSPP
jgi:hypothetical protein